MKKTKETADLNYRGHVIPRMISYLKPYRMQMFFCIVLVLAITGLELYRPILLGDAIDTYITGDFAPGEMAAERFAGVLRAAGWYVLILIALFVCSRAQFVLLQKVGQEIVYTIRNQVFAHVQSLTMRYFDLTPVGKIVTRVTNDSESVNELYANILVKLVKNFAKIIGLAVIMVFLNPMMALFSFSMVPLTFLLTYLCEELSKKAHRRTKTRITELNTFLSEHISGMKIIQIFHREEKKDQEFKQRSGDLYRANFLEIMVMATFRPLIFLTSIATRVIVLVCGGARVLEGTLTIGTLYVFIQYVKSFYEPIQELSEQFATLQSATASAEKIFTILDTEPLVKDPEEPKVLGEVRGRIEFDHVWFAYDGEDYVLKDVSFTIEPGQSVAFVGATGAGKSSILNLIGRYYDVQKGQIRIDGVDIRELSREEIRHAIGQVQQDVFLFTGNVAGNIRLRNEAITDEQIRKAAYEVNANRFIEKLPNGYEEKVTERGSTFSAGERQLISFARTLAYDPTILILDEATANIDTETEGWIQDALAKLMKGRTSIMVAHRLSTIQHADKIMVMHHGRIRETGTHQELLDQNGIYKKLYELQIS